MGTHSIYLYKEEGKKYAGCDLKITGLHDCALTVICAVIRSRVRYCDMLKRGIREICLAFQVFFNV